jgi:3-oxoacyl-[acyl-carrier protein] reductase
MSKVAIITGASGNGIGRSTAFSLAKAGYSVVINYRYNQNSAESISAYINDNGGHSIPIKANVFSKEECDSLINESIFNFQRIDALIIGPGAEWNPESPEKLNAQKSLLDVVQEIEPIYYLVPRVIPEMKKQKGGRIIGISSNPRLPSPAYSYNVAKASRSNALLGLVDSCWQYKITVNIIAPGPIDHFDTEKKAIQAASDENKWNDDKITPQDIAEEIVYLCSPKARYITGNVIQFSF